MEPIAVRAVFRSEGLLNTLIKAVVTGSPEISVSGVIRAAMLLPE
jgi:hypothetical protein